MSSANLFALHITQLQGYTIARANILMSSDFQAVLGGNYKMEVAYRNAAKGSYI